MKKKVLLTGGSGFLAGRIFDFLKEEYEIYLLSRNPNLKEKYKNSNFIVVDWDQLKLSEDWIDSIDIMIHTAGMNSIESTQNPKASYNANLLNTISLIDLIPKKSKKKLIYFSTAHVYSNPLVGKFTEDSPTTNVHPYASSHKAAEDYVLYQTMQDRIDGVVFRLSNVFGAPLYPDTNCWMLVINDLCRQAVEFGEMKLNSNGLQYRDFLQMNDLLKALHLFLETDFHLLPHRVFNLGGEFAVSIWDIANRIQKQAELRLQKKIPLARLENFSGVVPSSLDY